MISAKAHLWFFTGLVYLVIFERCDVLINVSSTFVFLELEYVPSVNILLQYLSGVNSVYCR